MTLRAPDFADKIFALFNEREAELTDIAITQAVLAPHPYPLPASGERETSTLRPSSFSPLAGRRCRQADEGQRRRQVSGETFARNARQETAP
ncbi:MAG: hypothetical protein ABL311_01730 [Nitratireductor rhodophyticola]|uniref:hypothetical protein n=1 Tax=Nitratireductor rhodophyticola TaxID=2854036 RepID=UPI0032D8C0D8